MPIKNGIKELEGLLAALEAQTLDRSAYEVVIADDHSTDGTLDLATRVGTRVICTTSDGRGSYAARNAGVRVSRGQLLAFCDADCRPEPTWLEAGMAAMKPGVVLAGDVGFFVDEEATGWGLADVDMYLDQARAVREARAMTANLFVERSDFLAVGGFSGELLSGGDTDFVRRAIQLGLDLQFAAGARVMHPVRNDARAFIEKTWRVCVGDAARLEREGKLRKGFRPARWVPLAASITQRRRAGRAALLDRRRLREQGLTVRFRTALAAVAVIHGVSHYMAVWACLSRAIPRRLGT